MRAISKMICHQSDGASKFSIFIEINVDDVLDASNVCNKNKNKKLDRK